MSAPAIGDRVRYHTPDGDRFADVSGIAPGGRPHLLVGLQPDDLGLTDGTGEPFFPDASGRTHVLRRSVPRGTGAGCWSPR